MLQKKQRSRNKYSKALETHERERELLQLLTVRGLGFMAFRLVWGLACAHALTGLNLKRRSWSCIWPEFSSADVALATTVPWESGAQNLFHP